VSTVPLSSTCGHRCEAVAHFRATSETASSGQAMGRSSAPFTVGANPVAVAFDGANIWVTNIASNNVTKLHASDGSLVGTFTVGTNPTGVAFDGANIWVANHGSANVTKLKATNGSTIGTFAVGSCPYYLAFDGAHIWVADECSNTVSKM
jgi:DNA-binding beta-propeller fold protein YncE